MENKRHLLCISLVLTLLLTSLLPAPALAREKTDMSAFGNISYVSPGDTFPAGKSGRWVVAERELQGEFLSEDPIGQPMDIVGNFTMIYKANVEMETQAGNFHGTLSVDPYALVVTGKSEPLIPVGWVYWEVAPGYWTWMPKMKLIISGRYTFTAGAHGNGNFNAEIVFVPTLDGHIDTVFPDESQVSMSGKW